MLHIICIGLGLIDSVLHSYLMSVHIPCVIYKMHILYFVCASFPGKDISNSFKLYTVLLVITSVTVVRCYYHQTHEWAETFRQGLERLS